MTTRRRSREELAPRRRAARRASPRATPGVVIRSSAGSLQERAACRRPAVSPCQTKRRSPTISVYEPEPLLLVVEQRLDRRDVEHADAVGGSLDELARSPGTSTLRSCRRPSGRGRPRSSRRGSPRPPAPAPGAGDVHPSRTTMASCSRGGKRAKDAHQTSSDGDREPLSSSGSGRAERLLPSARAAPRRSGSSGAKPYSGIGS